MTFIQSAILGIIEGATEYLPISSTFHLIWASRILGIAQTDFQKAFEVIIQGGAILAVILLYWKTILDNKKLILKLIFSFIPTAILGLVLYKIIKGTFFEDYKLQLFIFGFIGLFFILFEKYLNKVNLNKTLEKLTYKEALIIGLIQTLAVFPGVSRAGAVIVGMMFLKIKRDEAAKYSFLLAAPTLLAASVLDLYKSLPVLTAHPEKISLLAVGFISAFVCAYLVIKWFIKYLQNHTLSVFGIYRIILAGILMIYFLK